MSRQDDRASLRGLDELCTVVEAGPERRTLATNRPVDQFVASQAIVDSWIYLRGNKVLYCIDG